LKQPVELHERPLQFRGSRVARALLRLAGWRLQFDGLPAAQGVAVLYPHTSNWDFVIGILAKWATGMPVSFWSKDSMFRVALFGRWLRWLGGLPVHRDQRGGVVGQTVQAMQAAREEGRVLWLALTPEGTRARVDGWRSGFYHVALGAGVPVGLGVLDYGRRVVGIDSFWRLSGDPDADMATFALRLADCRGFHHRLAAPVRLLEP
jgi:1-acyl-sn-glycerol-3-phosphate acyltransferase